MLIKRWIIVVELRVSVLGGFSCDSQTRRVYSVIFSVPVVSESICRNISMLLVEQKLQAMFHTIIMIPSQVLFQSNWANLGLGSKNKKTRPYTYHTQPLLLVICPYFQNTEWSTIYINIGIVITLYFLHLSMDWFPDLISSFQSMASICQRSFSIWGRQFPHHPFLKR